MITSRNMISFLTSSLVSSLLDQLKTFWQLYLIESLGLLIDLLLLELQHLIYIYIYIRLLAGCGMLGFFTKSSPMAFQVGIVWYRKESPCKIIQSMLGLFKALFFIQLFSYCTLITFLMMLSVILLSMLMILLCIHLICDRVDFWPMRHRRLEQEVAFLFQCLENQFVPCTKNATCLIWPVKSIWW